MSSKVMQEISKSSVTAPMWDGQTWSKAFIIMSDFSGFQGHFPANPVLPAVVQFNMALNLIREVLDPCLQVENISRAKFSSVLGPEEQITVSCSIEEKKQSVSAFCQLYTDKEQASAFKMTLNRI